MPLLSCIRQCQDHHTCVTAAELTGKQKSPCLQFKFTGNLAGAFDPSQAALLSRQGDLTEGSKPRLNVKFVHSTFGCTSENIAFSTLALSVRGTPFPIPVNAMRGVAQGPPLPQILGNNECFEPYTSNIYVRRVLSGEFTVVNQHLLMDLTRLGMWSADLKNELVAAEGSVQVSIRNLSLLSF